MAEEQVLSQDEVNSLLEAVGEGQLDSAMDGLPPSPTSSVSVPESQKNYLPYDFSSPGAIAKNHLSAMHRLHQDFSRIFNSSLSNLLRTLVDVECDTVEPITYGDFVMSLSDPSCLCKLSMKPFLGTIVMEVTPDLVFPIVEKLLGGQGGGHAVPRRRMTEIEKEIIRQMIDLIARDLTTVWRKAKEDIQFRLDTIETNSDYVQTGSPIDQVMLVVLSVKFGRVQGMISISFPSAMIERILAETRFDELFLSSGSPLLTDEDEEYRPRIEHRLDRTRVPIRVIFPKTRVPVRELIQLKPGHIIELDVDVENKRIIDPVIVEVARKPRFLAKLGTFRKHKAVKIIGLVDREDDELSTNTDF